MLDRYFNFILAVVLMALSGLVLIGQDIQRDIFLSPDNKYSITDVKRLVNKEWEGSVFLMDIKSGKKIYEKQYDRSIDIKWSKIFPAFYLNDFGGSNYTESYLFCIKNNKVKIWKIRKLISKISTISKYLNEHHCYIELTEWTEKKVVGVVKGYGDDFPKGFKQAFTIDLERDLKWSSQ